MRLLVSHIEYVWYVVTSHIEYLWYVVTPLVVDTASEKTNVVLPYFYGSTVVKELH